MRLLRHVRILHPKRKRNQDDDQKGTPVLVLFLVVVIVTTHDKLPPTKKKQVMQRVSEYTVVLRFVHLPQTRILKQGAEGQTAESQFSGRKSRLLVLIIESATAKNKRCR